MKLWVESPYHPFIVSRLEVLLTVKGYLEDKSFRFFMWIKKINYLNCRKQYPYAIEQKIRAIGYIDCKWYIDLLIVDIRSSWKLWVLAKQPLFRLDWDLVYYWWSDPFIDNNFVERQAQHRPDRLNKPRTGSVGTDRWGRVHKPVRRTVRRKAGSV